MVLWLKALVALVEGSGLFPCTHTMVHGALDSSSRRSESTKHTLGAHTYMHTKMGTHKTNKLLNYIKQRYVLFYCLCWPESTQDPPVPTSNPRVTGTHVVSVST